MVISWLIGGLGNQMFQYAMGRSLSMRLNTPFLLDVSDFDDYQLHNGFELGDIFNIKVGVATSEDMRSVLGLGSYFKQLLKRPYMMPFRSKSFVIEPHFNYWPKVTSLRGDSFLAGYWQSEKYFLEVAQQIRKDFSFKRSMDFENDAISTRINQENAISLHVRRGDYVSNSRNLSVHGLCSADYYNLAINYISSRVSSPSFYIFSDDILWARNNLRINFPHFFVDINHGKNSHNDMRLMSLCKHHIIANSSFSWWGAWLNPNSSKIVVAPKRWFASDINDQDLIPSQWQRL